MVTSPGMRSRSFICTTLVEIVLSVFVAKSALNVMVLSQRITSRGPEFGAKMPSARRDASPFGFRHPAHQRAQICAATAAGLRARPRCIGLLDEPRLQPAALRQQRRPGDPQRTLPP